MLNGDDVRAAILEDEGEMDEMEIMFEQVEDFFESVQLHFAHRQSISPFILSPNQAALVNGKIEVSRRPNWILWSKHVVHIFKDLIVVKIAWSDSESCPFHDDDDENDLSPSSDWFFFRDEEPEKMFYLSDLMIHQITRHHFFPSPETTPRELIFYFGLRPGINYKAETCTETYWSPYAITACSGREKLREHELTEIDGYYHGEELVRVTFGRASVVHYNHHRLFLLYNCGDKLPKCINGAILSFETCCFVHCIAAFEIATRQILSPSELNKYYCNP